MRPLPNHPAPALDCEVMRRTAALLLAVATLAPGIARAEPVTVLGFESQGVPEAKAAAVTQAIRGALRAQPGVQLMPGKDIVELRMLFNCVDEATLGPCLAQAGRSLVVDKLVFGTVRAAGAKRSNRVDVEIRVLDVGREKIVGEVREVLDASSLAPSRIDAAASGWVNRLSADGAFAKSASPPAVAAKPAETKPAEAKPVETKPAEAKPVEAKPEETKPAEVAAVPPVAPAPEAPAAPGRTLKILGGIGLGLAVAAAGGAVVTGLRTQSLSTDAASALQPIATSTYAWNNRGQLGAGCDTPSGEMPAQSNPLRQYRDLCHDGQGFATMTTALWAVAGVFAAGGATALALGVRAAASKPERSDKPVSALEPPRLLIVPSFGPTGGGVSATVAF